MSERITHVMSGNTLAKKHLIIPDIHNDFQAAEKIIQHEKPDKIVFLGDYFDSLYDADSDATKTAQWLVKSLKLKNRIHLFGNHDLGYMTANPNLKCSGFAESKYHSIKRQSVPWEELKAYHWLDRNWLCTHAGVSCDFLKQQGSPKADSIQRVLDLSKKDLENIDDPNFTHSFFQIGFLRGGSNIVGGPLWCDFDEFVPISGLNQIFGHTKSDSVRFNQTENSKNYCIDTGLSHYAVYYEQAVKIKENPMPPNDSKF